MVRVNVLSSLIREKALIDSSSNVHFTITSIRSHEGSTARTGVALF